MIHEEALPTLTACVGSVDNMGSELHRRRPWMASAASSSLGITSSSSHPSRLDSSGSGPVPPGSHQTNKVTPQRHDVPPTAPLGLLVADPDMEPAPEQERNVSRAFASSHGAYTHTNSPRMHNSCNSSAEHPSLQNVGTLHHEVLVYTDPTATTVTDARYEKSPPLISNTNLWHRQHQSLSSSSANIAAAAAPETQAYDKSPSIASPADHLLTIRGSSTQELSLQQSHRKGDLGEAPRCSRDTDDVENQLLRLPPAEELLVRTSTSASTAAATPTTALPPSDITRQQATRRDQLVPSPSTRTCRGRSAADTSTDPRSSAASSSTTSYGNQPLQSNAPSEEPQIRQPSDMSGTESSSSPPCSLHSRSNSPPSTAAAQLCGLSLDHVSRGLLARRQPMPHSNSDKQLVSFECPDSTFQHQSATVDGPRCREPTGQCFVVVDDIIQNQQPNSSSSIHGVEHVSADNARIESCVLDRTDGNHLRQRGAHLKGNSALSGIVDNNDDVDEAVDRLFGNGGGHQSHPSSAAACATDTTTVALEAPPARGCPDSPETVTKDNNGRSRRLADPAWFPSRAESSECTQSLHPLSADGSAAEDLFNDLDAIPVEEPDAFQELANLMTNNDTFVTRVHN